nr:MAG TPA: hypothetical protein [Caudoviricetes sp.]
MKDNKKLRKLLKVFASFKNANKDVKNCNIGYLNEANNTHGYDYIPVNRKNFGITFVGGVVVNSDNIKDIMISSELKQRIDSILFEIKLINKLYSELLIEKSKNLLGLKYKNLIFFDSSETNFSYGTVKE